MGQWFFPVADNEGDRTYSDDDFAKYYANFFRTGVFATLGDGLQVLANATASMNVFLKTGGANLKGRQYYQDTDLLLQIGVSSALQDRVDGVVLRYSRSTRYIGVYVKTGDITVTRTADIFEIQLAQITVKKNVTSISQKDIKDMRADDTVCGFCTPYDELDVGDLMAQFKSELEAHQEMFEVWFQNLKDELDENQATNLQKQIDMINGVILQKDIPENANLDDYQTEGEFSKKTPTVVTGAPEGVTGAFRLSVRTMLGSSGIFQTLYDYGTRSMYFRIGNTSLGFNLPWQKVQTDKDDISETPLTMAEGYAANAAEYCIKDGWIFITVQGARPTATITGESYYTFLTLPAEITTHITHTEGFMWSNFQGGGTAYAGGILNNGQVQLYLSPKTSSISNANRFSFNMVIPMRNT